MLCELIISLRWGGGGRILLSALNFTDCVFEMAAYQCACVRLDPVVVAAAAVIVSR